jgi:hypothetical protein
LIGCAVFGYQAN